MKHLTIIVALLLSGCASSHILIGKTRPPIDADEVKVYFSPPPKFEEIAIVEASSKSSFAVSDQGKTDVMLRRLKEEAAGLGANGLLLHGLGDESVGAVGVSNRVGGGTSIGYSAGAIHKTGQARAIYVIPE